MEYLAVLLTVLALVFHDALVDNQQPPTAAVYNPIAIDHNVVGLVNSDHHHLLALRLLMQPIKREYVLDSILGHMELALADAQAQAGCLWLLLFVALGGSDGLAGAGQTQRWEDTFLSRRGGYFEFDGVVGTEQVLEYFWDRVNLLCNVNLLYNAS